ncbi:hypothetical protein DFH06DRAFT_1143174 [Mycena polygramma]|nr:hypothetical protein DFH06DRAFT_1143174 [Mycena polygramma]
MGMGVDHCTLAESHQPFPVRKFPPCRGVGVRKLNGKYKRINRLQTVVNENGWSLTHTCRNMVWDYAYLCADVLGARAVDERGCPDTAKDSRRRVPPRGGAVSVSARSMFNLGASIRAPAV